MNSGDVYGEYDWFDDYDCDDNEIGDDENRYQTF